MDIYLTGSAEMDAIAILNKGRSNLRPQEELVRQRTHSELELQVMSSILEQTGLTVGQLYHFANYAGQMEDIDRLNIIHVAGTKGKGSTCAFTERILRSHGYRTGFYCSPHLVQFRERIRINGQPIETELFTKMFWHVYRQLDELKDVPEKVMPTFSRILTVMAFHVFLQEKVDVAIIEVGMGGAYDFTNIIRHPWVCGVTLLDIDHSESLGDTIEKIAWHKGGIFKPGVPAFTTKQPGDAMSVLRDRAKELGCPLGVCPELEEYQSECGPLRLGLAGKHQHSNASLALQLSNSWLQRRRAADTSSSSTIAENIGLFQAASFKLSPIMVKALADTEWPGRTQVIKDGAVTYFLDGAHTIRSMQACADWFREATAHQEKKASGPVTRVLLYNTTGERDFAGMVKQLVPCQFDFALFCPNITGVDKTDQQKKESMLTRCLDIERSWCLHNSQRDHTAEDSLVFPSILSGLQWITQGRDSVVAAPAKPVLPVKPSIMAKAALLCDAAEIHVLITGSLYLVGGALSLLEPSKWTL